MFGYKYFFKTASFSLGIAAISVSNVFILASIFSISETIF
jgi:hypothetical protein